jgi:hypothetical protein
VRNAPVYKTDYVTPRLRARLRPGRLLQPIQQHSWDLTWAVPDPRGVHNTIFSVQPLRLRQEELMMYFTEMPDYMPACHQPGQADLRRAEDKILGCSPYEQVFQTSTR